MDASGNREERARRVGMNEALFREVNERIENLAEEFGVAAGSITVVCECGDGTCTERLEVEKAVYERVRSDAHRFLVAPDHELPDVETVVERLGSCVVVSKDRGMPEHVAEETDPR
jgi:hypothetical protein